MLKHIRNLLIEWIGTLLIRIIGPTLRITLIDESGLSSDPHPPQAMIFAFWHNRMLMMPYLYRRFFPKRRGVCLVSVSQDGEMIARILKRFDFGTVRGSSSRRGKEAFRALVTNLRDQWDVGITPDGPRGPRYQAQVGVVGLAALSGCPLIPISYNVKWKIELPTWDRFMIPIPFSVCHFQLGKPMIVSNEEMDSELEKSRLELEKQLGILSGEKDA